MITIPDVVNVADLQRRYRSLVNDIKRTGRPKVVLSNGDPDVVIMGVATYNSYTQRFQELEEEYLLAVAQEGMAEYKEGKTKTLKKGQRLIDLIK